MTKKKEIACYSNDHSRTLLQNASYSITNFTKEQRKQKESFLFIYLFLKLFTKRALYLNWHLLVFSTKTFKVQILSCPIIKLSKKNKKSFIIREVPFVLLINLALYIYIYIYIYINLNFKHTLSLWKLRMKSSNNPYLI